jgi:hypothetical protein
MPTKKASKKTASKKPTTKKKTRKVSRSAVDGEFVSKKEALENPRETITQTVPVGNRKKDDDEADSTDEVIAPPIIQETAQGAPVGENDESGAQADQTPSRGDFAAAQVADFANPGDCESELLEIGHQEAIKRGIVAE